MERDGKRWREMEKREIEMERYRDREGQRKMERNTKIEINRQLDKEQQREIHRDRDGEIQEIERDGEGWREKERDRE